MAAAQVQQPEYERELEEIFEELGHKMPPGLRHILFHSGKTRKEVYRSLWGSLMHIGKLKMGGNRTLVYPEEVRDAVRHRFNDDPDAGAYDRQYLHQGYHVCMEELANCPYKGAPLKCRKCTA